MNTRKLLSIVVLAGLLASACQPAASTPEASYRVEPSPPVSYSQPPSDYLAPAPTNAPPVAPQPVAPAPAVESSEPSLERSAGEAPLPAADAECCPQPPPPPIQPQPYPTAAPYPTPAPETYPETDFDVNPYIDTRYDHLSTFAMDVDTASYTKMREYINSNTLPPTDLVRVEEFINFFNMEYPDPESGAFSINLEGGPAPFAQQGTYLLKVGIQGRHIPDWDRKDALLTFVIDASGSMHEGDKMRMVKDGLRYLVDQLGPDDMISIVAFSNDAWTVLEPTSVYYRDHILNAINSLQPMNSTNTEAGLRLGYDIALRNYRDGAINRVILASDGMANVGNTNPEVLVGYAREYYNRNVFLSTVGVGRGGYDDRFMEQLADNGNGNYSYLDSRSAAERIFGEGLNSTLQVIAKDAKIQVDFNPAVVSSYRLLGYENRAVADQDFRNNAVDAGEVGAGHSVTALYEVILNPEAHGEVATVRVRHEDPDTHAVTEISNTINSDDFKDDFGRMSPRFQLAATVAQYAELLRHSPWTWGEGLNQMLDLARFVQIQLPFDSDVAEFVSLVERSAWLGR